MNASEIKHVVVLGAGVLGAQIAFQASFHGFQVTSYDIDQVALDKAKKRFDGLAQRYKQDLKASEQALQDARARLSQSCDLAEAVKTADVIIEAAPENLQLKKTLWEQVGKLAPSHTIFCTNTSTLLPSLFNESSGDPSRFLALHFANQIWLQNIVEVMGTAQTNPALIDTVATFAKAMGMEPIIIKKEVAGYVMNRLLVPFLTAASHLLADDVASPKEIDLVWQKATGAPKGPCEIMDIVGLRTVYAIHSAKAHGTPDPLTLRFAELIKTQYLDRGHLGKESGQGFFRYDENGNVIE